MEEIISLRGETEERENKVSDKVIEILDKLPSDQQSKNPEERNKGLSSLSDEFVTELRGHIYNVIRTEGQREKEGKPNQMERLMEDPERFIRGHIKGEVFERLVVVDPIISKERFRDAELRDPSKMEKTEKLSMEILSVMQDPSRYGLEGKIELRRLPDATYINITDEGFVEILGVGEAKSGIIGDRFFSQASTYHESAEIIAKELSKLRHVKRLRNLGLNLLADRMENSKMDGVNNFVRVSGEFKKTLIVPQDKIISDRRIYSSVDKVIRSSFTNYEIEAITDFVFEEISKVDENFSRARLGGKKVESL
jgi:hypothetical protein